MATEILQHLVSARKYRPQTFSTVIGQEHITTTLKNAIRQNKLAHAYLFCGPRGVGKTSCARILARTINCEQPTADLEACGECATCRALQENASFNVFELDAASNNSVDDIRELVSGVRFAPQQGKYKIYIIDEVHMLTTQAFNAFLKTLEEPPPYAIFILATTEKHKILPTILSRCQIFDFRRIRTEDTVAHLQGICELEGRKTEEAALHLIAQKSEGCMRDALSLMDRIAAFADGSISLSAAVDQLAILDTEFYFQLTDQLLCGDVAGALLGLNTALERGFEGSVVLDGLAEHFRNLLLCKEPRMTQLLDVPPGQRKLFYEKALQAPPSFILSGLAILNDAAQHYKEAGNRRLHTELCLVRLSFLLQEVSPEQRVNLQIPQSTAPGIQPQEPARPKAAPPQQPAAPAPLDPRPVSPPPQPPREAPPQQRPPEAKPLPVAQPPAAEQPRNNATPADLQEPPTPAPPPIAMPAPAPSKRGRVRADILAELDADIAEATPCPGKQITDEEIQAAYTAYYEKLRAADQQFLAAQYHTTRVEWRAPDEAHFIAPSEMAYTCLVQLRNELHEFLKVHTGCDLRLTLEHKEDHNQADHDMEKVLSKPELLEELMRINPNLRILKEGLGLQLDF